MSASYWQSSQAIVCIINHSAVINSANLNSNISHRDVSHLHFFYTALTTSLAKKLSLRQSVIASALVYFKRYFLLNSFQHTDPLLVIATAVFLASKVEECPIPLKSIVDNFRNLLFLQSQNLGTIAYLLNTDTQTANVLTPFDCFPYDAAAIAEFEFYLLEHLGFYLILHHPYHPLSAFVADLGLEKTLLGPAWYVVNDAYKTHLPLMHPPHVLALAAIYIVGTLHEELLIPEDDAFAQKVDLAAWLGALDVDLEAVVRVASNVLLVYQEMEVYDDKAVVAILERLRPGRLRRHLFVEQQPL